MDLLETLNRTVKLAMDEGRVNSYEEAQTLFGSFRLRVNVQSGFTAAPAAEAAVLTLLNAAPKTFLGGVKVLGPLEERCTRGWFVGKTLGEVAGIFGVAIAEDGSGGDAPTIHVGGNTPREGALWLGISLTPRGFILSPDASATASRESPVEAGIAAAGAALNEVFQSAYRNAPLAGQREIRWKLPEATNKAPSESVWLIGLGHLGQAFLWAKALAGGSRLPRAVRLTDYDSVSWSSLSTCLLVRANDIGRKKVDAVGDQLEAIGVHVQRDYDRLELNSGTVASAQTLAVIAVDNIALRRSLDRLHAKRVLEAGIGDGPDAFTRVQLHAFPGPRMARDIWAGDDAGAARTVNLSKPAYQALLAKSGDECGTTLVAGHPVATPFVGAFGGAMLSVLDTAQLSDIHAWNYDVNNL